MARSVTLETNFSAGWISEAAAADLTNEQRESGLVIAENVEILRDGGLRTRPGLQLVAGDFPRIQYAPRITAFTDGWTVEDVESQEPVDLSTPLSVPASGILSLGWRLDSSASPYRFGFTFGGRAVRAVTLHDCRLTLGNAVKQDGSLSFVTERNTAGAIWGRADQDDHLAQNVFLPGLVSRDVTVRLKNRTDDTTYHGVYFKADTAALRLEIGGVSVFEELKEDGTPAQAVSDDSQRLDVGRQHRLIPWVLGEQHVALVIGLDRISGFLLNDREDLPRPSLFDSVGDWIFTPRQIREMTWCRYERGLLLFHTDFPPLNVRITDAGEFSIAPLALENMPDLPTRLATSARGEISIRSGKLAITRAAGTLPAPQGVSAILSTTVANRIDVSWQEAADAASYDLVWSTKAVYDADPAAWRTTRAASVTSANLPGSKQTGLTALTTGVSGLTAGTEYVFAVRAVYPDGISDLSPVVSATSYPLPAQVTGFRAIQGNTAASRSLSWTAVAYATRYEIQVRVQGASAWGNAGSVSGTSTTFLAAEPSADLEFRVRAVTPVGPGAWSASASVSGVPDVAAPTGFAASLSAVVSNRIDVSWTRPANATRIELEWRQHGGGSWGGWTRVSLGAVSSYAHTGRTAGVAYQYRVRMLDRFGRESGWTTPSGATSYPLPGTPTGASARASGSIGNRIDFAWTNPAWTSAVQIQIWQLRAADQGGNYARDTYTLGRTGTYAYTRATNAEHTCRVRIQDPAGRWGAWSAFSNAAWSVPNPGTPSSVRLTPSATVDNRLDIAWTNPSYTRAVQVQIDSSRNAEDQVQSRGAVTSTSITLAEGSTVRVRVRAQNLAGRWGGWSAWSDSVQASRLRPGPPTLGEMFFGTNRQSAVIRFNPVAGALRYEATYQVQIRFEGRTAFDPLRAGSQTISADLSPLFFGVQTLSRIAEARYTNIRIRTIGRGGAGAWSSFQSRSGSP